jgi:hypothetical protein
MTRNAAYTLLRPLPALALLLCAAALGAGAYTAAGLLERHAGGAPIALEWAQLIPPGEAPADPRALARGVVPHGGLDPAGLENSQPGSGGVVRRYDGRRVRIVGYVVPLDYDGTKVMIFLLVPYFGACIHVPPPPPNQIVYVLANEGIDLGGDLSVPVRVTGTLTTLETVTEFAEVSYEVRADEVSID